MLQYKELKAGFTKVLLPNGFVGLVTDISPISTVKGGLLRGRGKVKCSYNTGKGGQTEGWFQLGSLRKYEIVIKKIPNDVQPVEQGEEPWKAKDTFNGTKIVDQTKVEEVIVPVVGATENIIESGINDVIPTNTQNYAGKLSMDMVEKMNEIAPPVNLNEDEIKEIMEDNKEVISEIPDAQQYDGKLTVENLNEALKENKEVINELPDVSKEDEAIDDDSTELGG